MHEALLFHLDYPSTSEPLCANVRSVSGWCFHPSKTIDAIEFYVNGRFSAAATLRQPRMDVSAAFPERGEAALLSGFHGYFNPALLDVGENLFAFRIRVEDSYHTISKVVVKPEALLPLKMTDVFIDIVGSCNLRCVMCPQGRSHAGERQAPRGRMAPELFDRILSRLADQGFVGPYVNLYNWGDPLLHPELGRFLEICHRRGLKAIISTNLSYPERFLQPLKELPLEVLIVSISGFSQEIYARNHVGGKIDWVRRNLLDLKGQDNIKTILVKYLVFTYNGAEIEYVKAFCRENGFSFGAYYGTFLSTESFFQYHNQPAYLQVAADFVAIEDIGLQPARFCPQETSITINHKGELERCCVSWNQGLGRSILEADLRPYLERKVENDFCARCLASGFSQHKHYGVMVPALLAEAAG